MIQVGQDIIESKHFPDGTPMLLDMPHGMPKEEPIEILWLYDKGEEFALYATCLHYSELGYHINLTMPYVPNARMDRTKSEGEVHTLHAFCHMLGSIPNIDSISIWDPHSEETVKQLTDAGFNVDVAEGYRALFASIWYVVGGAIGNTKSFDYICFPDAGAKDKYSKLFPKYQRVTSALKYLSEYPQIYGMKHRDWETGKILGLSIVDADGNELEEGSLDGKKVLIVDDICAYGGTIYYSALKLRELGAETVSAHISHTEDSIFEGHLLKSSESPINAYFTTNDILHIDKATAEHNVPLNITISF